MLGAGEMQEPTGSWLSQDSEADEITLRLTERAGREKVAMLKLGQHFSDELEKLWNSKKFFDLILVDATECGFLFSAEDMISAATAARDILEVQGALVFVKLDKAAAFIKESPVGFLSFHVFETFSDVYDYSTSIAKHIQQAMGQTIEIRRESADLSEQILLTIIPVLTNFGIKLKASVEGAARRNKILNAIDNYTPLNAIAQRLAAEMNFSDLLEDLKQIEKSGAIYPIFPKVPFLLQHFRSGKQFKLREYLLEARLITREQLDEVIFAMQSTKSAQRLSLGSMCVARGLLSARQLEIALQDQSYFGQMREIDKGKILMETDDAQVQSLVGNLGTTDPAAVLQNLASSRSNGVVVVEHRGPAFRAAFEQGKLICARLGKLKGNAAVYEFVSVWKDGVFVFLERSIPDDLQSDECKVTRPIDKLLLDSALAQDNIEALYARLKHGEKSILERIADSNNVFGSGYIVDPQEGYQLEEEEVEQMKLVWKVADGLSSLSDLRRLTPDLTTFQFANAVSRLLYYELVREPGVELNLPLSNFRHIVSLIASKLGVDRVQALLRLSLRESQGYSAVARVFSLGSGSELGVDLSAAKSAGLSLSHVVKALEDWQVKFIEDVSLELDKDLLRDLVKRVYGKK